MVVKSYLDVPHSKRAPMTNYQSELYLKCTFIDMAPKRPLFEECHAKELGIIGQIIWSRLNHADKIHSRQTKVSAPAALFLTELSDGVPGRAVMWAYTLFQMGKKYDVIDCKALGMEFPLGFPTEDGFIEVWDGQKGHAHGQNTRDNLLDGEWEWERQ